MQSQPNSAKSNQQWIVHWINNFQVCKYVYMTLDQQCVKQAGFTNCPVYEQRSLLLHEQQ